MIKENTIYNENCLNTLSNISNEAIDMVLTSPPYDSIRNYNGYSFDFEKIAQELFRVIKKGGVVIWVVGDQTVNGSETGTSFKQALYFKEIGFNIHDTMIYAKNNPMPTGGVRYHQNFEYMFCFSKGKPKTFNPIMVECKYKGMANMKNRGVNGEKNYRKVKRNEKRKVGNIFTYSIGGGISTKDKKAYSHPAIFPEKLAEDQIQTWSNEGDLIYDPFCGSGTTVKVAKNMNRKWLGSEISEEYFSLILDRLSS
jgi:DNA modification methylase